ncbi:GAF domain-containing protein [uncultured Rhodoblastus sp.]|uniref:GAF domain-containing protein n=1 Tax=uncultured Rhodoblastus sp. TaxID=543037 RepID=UPI0025D876C9|nr:GAF domain-containing protein [uncultured Rhodoblastus sp.]
MARTLARAETPDAIQPQGWLIVCDSGASRVRRHSSNLAGLFPAWPGPFIGANLREILGPQVTHSLRNALSRFASPAPPALLTGLLLPGCAGAYDLAVHAIEDETVIEIEPAAPENDRSLLDRLRAFIARLAQAGDLDKTLQAAARLCFAMLQYDRVAVLRLDALGRATLVAEQKAGDLDSWSGSAGPPAIFSEETRAKWLACRLRLLIDADSPPAAILGAPEAGALDLTLAFLRAPSPDERAVLRQSGAAAALAIAIVVDGLLWGLVFCAHRTPRHPAMELRAAAELFGEFLSLRLQVLSPQRTAQKRAARPAAALDGLRVMIVEDQALIAMDLEASLTETGVTVASVCTSCAEALMALESVEIDAAILDYHLHGETSLAVAEALEKRAIPFIFVTGESLSGQGDDPKPLTRLAGRALARKPYEMGRIMAALGEALADPE